MNYEPKTPLNLSLSSRNNEIINLDLMLDPSYPNSYSISPPLSPIEPRVFSCNYCRRKFYSSQALGGHQNAHKLERTLAKKSRESSSVVRPHSGSNQRIGPSSSGLGRVHVPIIGIDHHGHAGRFGRSRDVNYDHDWIDNEYFKSDQGGQDDQLNQIDLSLRL